MSLLRRVRSLLGVVRERDRFESDMAEEFQAHLEMRAADLVKKGMGEAAAMRQARLEFGSVESYKEQGRESRGLRWLEEVRGDAAYAARVLRRSPGYAAVAVLTLALGVGANATIFSLAERVLLRPINAPDLDRLYTVRADLPTLNLLDTPLSPLEVSELRARGDLEGIAGYRVADRTVSVDGGEPIRALGAGTLGDFGSVFGAQALLGRMYPPEQSEEGPTDVVVISHDLWQRIGGGDSSFVGAHIDLDGMPHEVIGVMAPEFDFPRRAELWVPFNFSARWREPHMRGTLIMDAVVRAPAGMTREQVQHRLDAQVAAWRDQLGWPADESGRVLHAKPLVEHLAGPLRTVMLVLTGAVVFVLLIAATNLASLQLVRTVARAREIAVRRALGASHARVARQILTEGALIGVSGAAAGLLLGVVILRALRAWEPAQEMYLDGARMDGSVLLATVAMAAVTTVAFSLMPAMRGARIEPQSMLRQSQPGANVGAHRQRLLKSAMVAQVAIALVLLLGSLLMVRTLSELVAGDPGFDAEGLMTAQISLPGGYYDTPEKALAFYDALLARAEALPAVTDAAIVFGLPFSDQNDSSPIEIPDRPHRPGDPVPHAEARMVSAGYFETMGIPLIRGSGFTGNEVTGAPLVAVVDRTFAEQFFPGEDPVGRRFRSYFGEIATIIGVAERVDHDEVGDAPKAVAYYSYRVQPWSGWRAIVLRSDGEEAAAAGALRSLMTELDPRVPLYDIRSMQARIEASLGPRRLATIALVGFALLAVLLATFGVYGVMRYTTDLRRQELGLRLAIGAQPGRLVAMVVRQGVIVGLAGVGIGVAAAFVLTRFMAAMLYGVQPHDPLAFAAGALVLVAVAAVASLLPARRAARIDPILTLRSD